MFVVPAQPMKLCIDCKHFKAPEKDVPIKHGKCTKFLNINKVDGSVEYSFASVARFYDCKDKHYEPKESK